MLETDAGGGGAWVAGVLAVRGTWRDFVAVEGKYRMCIH